jgi:C-terminal peptidase prc
MKMRHVSKTVIGLMALSIVAVVSSGVALADDPPPAPSTPAPKPLPDLAKRVQEITDVVLEHHIDPPARQQMILSGIKALYGAAGVPVPAGLGRRVSAIATTEQLAAFLADVWPKATAKPVAAKDLEEGFLIGLRRDIPGRVELNPANERKVAEQLEGNRYVGLHIALAMDEKEKRTKLFEVFEGGPADRAGVKKDDWLEEVDGVDTKGMKLQAVVERIRGEEGTAVTIKIRQPQETKSRTYTITRGRHMHPTIFGIRKRSSGGWDVRLNGTDPIGYLRISQISASTPHELRKMARQLETEGARALALDLRGLRGDSVHTAVLLADSLLDHGLIGRVRTARGETIYEADSDALFLGWPMAVLVNESTGETAEWLAAALQDNHRAILIGTPTLSAVAPSSAALVRSTIAVGDGTWSITLPTGRFERGDGRALGGETSSAPDNTRGFVFRADDLDELEQVAKRVLEWSARESRKGPNQKSDARAHKSVLPGENAKTGVKPDDLIGETLPAAAGSARPESQGQDRQPTMTSDRPLEKAVERLRQSLKKS